MSRLILAVALGCSVSSAAFAQHDHHASMTETPPPALKEGGQSAFAAITEIVAKLLADPGTDWSRVHVDALRDHLVDMDNVTLHATVTRAPVANGMRFEVSGAGPVRDSIRRMAAAHTKMADSLPGMRTVLAETPEGVAVTATGRNAADAEKIRALGFFGLMTTGVHHQDHHLRMARGEMHH